MPIAPALPLDAHAPTNVRPRSADGAVIGSCEGDVVLADRHDDGTWRVGAFGGRARRWELPAAPEIVECAGDVAVLGTWAHHVVAVDAVSGELRWSAPGDGSAVASVAAGEDLVVVGFSSGRVLAWSPDGTPRGELLLE